MKLLQKMVVAGFALLSTTTVFAQNVREVAIKMNKVEQKALAADYPYAKGFVTQALDEKFNLAKFGKSKRKSGFDVYSGVSWMEVAPADKLDVYVKTEERKGNTTVSILLSRGYDNFLTSTADATQIENLKTFLTGLSTGIQAAELQKKIEDQMKVVKAAEDKSASVAKDYESLKSQKEKVEKSMEQNLDAQKKANSDVDAAKAVLEQLKSQLAKP